MAFAFWQTKTRSTRVYTLLYLVSICTQCVLSQFNSTTSDTMATSDTTITWYTSSTTQEEDGAFLGDFLVMSTLEIFILAAVGIGCTLFVGILCCCQKNKTKKFERHRQHETDELFADVERKRQQKMSQMRRQQSLQQQHMYNQQQPQQPHVQPQPRPQTAMRPTAKTVAVHSAGSSGGSSSAHPHRYTVHAQPNMARVASMGGARRPMTQSLLRASAPKEGDVPPPPPPESAPPSDVIELAERREQRAKSQMHSLEMIPLPPAPGPAPVSRAKSVVSTSSQRPGLQNEHSFQKVLSVPTISQATSPAESALTLPDVERDAQLSSPPQSAPPPKAFDPDTGSPRTPDENENANDDEDSINRKVSIVVDDDGDAKRLMEIASAINDDDGNGDGHMYKASMMTAIVHHEDEEKSEHASSSSTSSGDGIHGDRHLLAIAQQQMENNPPPSLQTIFHRNVQREDDGTLQGDSDSNDSLMERQQQFIANPDQPESNLHLNI